MFLEVSFCKFSFFKVLNYLKFRRIYTRALVQTKDVLVKNPNVSTDQIYNPVFRRGIFTVGLLMRYFDFSRPDVNGSNTHERSKIVSIFF